MKGEQKLRRFVVRDRQGGSTLSITWHLFACGAQKGDANTGPLVSFERFRIRYGTWNLRSPMSPTFALSERKVRFGSRSCPVKRMQSYSAFTMRSRGTMESTKKHCGNHMPRRSTTSSLPQVAECLEPLVARWRRVRSMQAMAG